MMGTTLERAEFASLRADVVEDIRILTEFFDDRDRILAAAFGRRVRRSPLADSIMRQMVLEFSAGRVLSIAAYQKAQRSLGSPNTIREKILEMESGGVLVLCQNGKIAKAVFPTKATISMYNTCMPQLRDEAAKRLCRHVPDDMDLGEICHPPL